MKKIKWLLFFTLGLFLGAIHPAKSDSLLNQKILFSLNSGYIGKTQGMRFELEGPLTWVSEIKPAVTDYSGLTVAHFSEVTPGQIQVQFSNEQESFLAIQRIKVLMKAYVTNKRILPLEKIDFDQLEVKDVDVTSGVARELRGLVFTPTKQIKEKLQSRQTILEGSFLTSNVLQRIHDVKRGDMVKVKFLMKDVQVSLMGIVDEPGYLNENVHVTCQKTKQKLVGLLKERSLVEVSL